MPWTFVAAFFALACGLAWLVCLPLWVSGEGLATPLAGLSTTSMMFTPLVAALVVMFVLQRARHKAEYLGLWPLRPLKRTVWMSVIAIFGSALIVIAGTFLAAALGVFRLDLVHFSGFAATLHAATSQSMPLPIGLLVALQILAIPFGAIINGVVTIGEELGWRGWLLPTLRPLGTWPALLITGMVWGFWHSPIILLGYNFNQPNILGVLLMIGGCVFFGVLVGWLRLRTASVWPCVFAHGAFNAAGGFFALVGAAGSRPNLAAVNPLGWVTWIVMAVVIVILVVTGQFRRQPRLERRAAPVS